MVARLYIAEIEKEGGGPNERHRPGATEGGRIKKEARKSKRWKSNRN